MTHINSYAIVGGGLAGLSSAYQLSQLKPDAQITIFEKGSAQSYAPSADDVGRASLSASPARTLRLTGATEGAGQWAVQETKAMLDTIQADIKADPANYPGLENKKLLTPQPTVIVGPNKDDNFYCKSLETIKSSGAAYEETDGATLKGRFPNLYKTLPDNAAVLIEAPAGPNNVSGVAGLMDVESTLKAITQYLKKKGATIRAGETVTSVDQGSGHAIVTTPTESNIFEKAIIAPGQWIESLVDTKEHNIQTRYDRVVVLDIDMKALGLQTNGIPFTKGLAPEGGKGSFYSFLPDASAGHVKFIPAATVRSVNFAPGLKAPITEDEKETALSAAAIVLQVDKEKLRAAATPSLCAYTSPKIKENALITNISENVVLNGLDSSGSARTSGGLGKIAASMALGLDEPYPGTNDKYSLAAHHALVGEAVQVARQSSVQRMWNDLKHAIGF